ncbi:hypothetical protein V2J09_010933 [Rumex salicifolius]
MASLRLVSRFLRGPATATIPATGRLFSSAAGHHETPQIELEFVSASSGSDGQYSVEKATAESGEKRLRNIMLDNNIDLYASFRKVVNCGGRGLCGTCMVEKPDSWRLACQTTVGNKENSGKVVVQKMPQTKK